MMVPRGFWSHACRRHTQANCPTREWVAGATTLSLTPAGELVRARVYDNADAALTAVNVFNEWWSSQATAYDVHGLPRPEQFTEAGRLRHLVWQGDDKPVLDVWGRPVR